MTLEEMKKKILSMIEELSPENPYLTDDVDIQAKINSVINQIQFELARFKKIPAQEVVTVAANEEYDVNDLDGFYQLRLVRGAANEVIDNLIIFEEAGTAKIFYYKYPNRITDSNATTYKFIQSEDVLEIMPYGVAADLLKSDVASNYGAVYAQRYREMIQQLDPRYSLGSVHIGGGVSL